LSGWWDTREGRRGWVGMGYGWERDGGIYSRLYIWIEVGVGVSDRRLYIPFIYTMNIYKC